jgi:hypothetical protein
MDVIRDASDAIAFAAGIASHSGKIGVENRLYRRIKGLCSISGAEDDMDSR